MRAALLGLACGDALGTTHEFQKLAAPRYPQLADGPLRTIVGGGPFHVAPGQVTDDTQMAVCLTDSLVASGSRFDVHDVARRYVEWMHSAFDIGSQTRDALERIEQGASPLVSGREVWLERGRAAAGNGSLMRVAPIGVFIHDPDQRRRASIADSAITHFDPRCQLACASYTAAVAAGIRGAAANEMWEAAYEELSAAVHVVLESAPDVSTEIEQARHDLVDDLDIAWRPDPQLYGPTVHLQDQQGFVRVAFRLAFWHLRHTTDGEQALIDVVNRGGDADTNAAIVGALMGACYGDYAMPIPWWETVLLALQDGEPSKLSGAYHPRQFMTALAHLAAG